MLFAHVIFSLICRHHFFSPFQLLLLFMAAANFMNLKVVSVNVKGICNPSKRKAMSLFRRHTNADVIFFRRLNDNDDGKFWRSHWGDQFYLSHAFSHMSGVAILLLI